MNPMFSRLLTILLLGGWAASLQAFYVPPPYVCPSLPQEEIERRLPPAVAAQVRCLYSQETSIQGKALVELTRLGGEAAPALPYIFAMCEGKRSAQNLEGNPDTIGSIAEQALAAIAKDVPEAFLPALDDPTSPNLRLAIRAVAGCDAPGLEQRLLKLSTMPDENVRQEAARNMVFLYGLPDHGEATKRVDELLRQDPSPQVRCQILKAVPERGPMPAGDPREALLISALQKESANAEDMALYNYRGTPSPELFNAVFATLDRNLCSRTSKHSFLTNHVGQAEALLTDQLKDKDEGVRQRAYLLLYHYLPDVSDEYLDRLFAEPLRKHAKGGPGPHAGRRGTTRET